MTWKYNSERGGVCPTSLPWPSYLTHRAGKHTRCPIGRWKVSCPHCLHHLLLMTPDLPSSIRPAHQDTPLHPTLHSVILLFSSLFKYYLISSKYLHNLYFGVAIIENTLKYHIHWLFNNSLSNQIKILFQYKIQSSGFCLTKSGFFWVIWLH